jgi:hypothetical protein
MPHIIRKPGILGGTTLRRRLSDSTVATVRKSTASASGLRSR